MATKPAKRPQEQRSREKRIPSQGTSGLLFEIHDGDDDTPVECLGITFQNDAARRHHFLELLREKLKDPEFRRIEGFPTGEDEDILAMSDPPYYTACPNPFLDQFVAHYTTPYDPSTDTYKRPPFSADVREGKNDPLYTAHAYHTKVPHKAIMRYLLHYTNPGDIVFDGFCGTGMTGVAAQLCGDQREVEKLGYQVSRDGRVADEQGESIATLGVRPAVVSDLAPIATFIARNLLSPVPQTAFVDEANRILKRAKERLPDIYSVRDPQTNRVGELIYSVWSDFLVCSTCGGEINSWDVVVDHDSDRMHGEFACPHCAADLKRRALNKVLATNLDPILNAPVQQTKQRLQILHFKLGQARFEKHVDDGDLAVFEAARRLLSEYSVPTASFEHTWRHLRDGNHLRGITHSHHYYTPRNLVAMACLLEQCRSSRFPLDMLFIFTGFLEGHANRRNRYIVDRHHPKGTTCGPLSNTLFVPELQCEINIFNCWEKTLKKQAKAKSRVVPRHCFVQTRSASNSGLPDNSVDYIFIDPPFGKNIMYSDLNLLYESWLGVRTAISEEAIVNDRQQKGLAEYGKLIFECLAEFHRILKPGRWMTLEFHNSLNSVWSRIQEALARAGFVVADVRVLDKKQGTLHQDSGYTVKRDLIISAYKPSNRLADRFKEHSGATDGVWEFVTAHLQQLPLSVTRVGYVEPVAERESHLLFDRMVAFHVQRGVPVPLSAPEFRAALQQKFPKRDGMYFLPEQIAEYDRERSKVERVAQLKLFVSDEASAIRWVKRQVQEKPQTFRELHPPFMRELTGWEKHEQTFELVELLEQNCICYDGEGPVPSQIHDYLSSNFKGLRDLDKDDFELKAQANGRWYLPDPRREIDLEKIRHRALMKEFDTYKEGTGKITAVRTEALRAGFAICWQKNDYQTILLIAERVKQTIIQEDPTLLMYYDNARKDNARMRTEG